MRFIETQTSIKAGRLSRKLDGRIDIKQYKDGARVLDNMLPMKTGGAKKETGIVPVSVTQLPPPNPLPASVHYGRSKFFSMPDGNVYRFELHQEAQPDIMYAGPPVFAVSIFRNNIQVRIRDPLYIPYDDYKNIQVAQYEDKVFYVHNSGDYSPRFFQFFDTDQFGFGDLSSASGISDWHRIPFEGPNLDPATSINITNTNNYLAVNLSLSSGNIGDYVEVNEWLFVVGVVKKGSNKDVLSNYYKVLSVNGGGTSVTCRAFLQDGDQPAQDIMEDGEYDEWYFPSFGKRNGWPKSVSVHSGRLIYGGTKKKSATFYGSMVNNPLFMNDKRIVADTVANFSYYGESISTDPYQFTLGTKRTCNIKFIESTSEMVIGTDERLYVVSANGGIVEKKNVDIRPFVSKPSGNLSASFGNEVYYTSADYKQLMRFRYNQENGSFIAEELSILSDDLYETATIESFTWHELEDTLFIVMSDGSVHAITINDSVEVRAYSTVSVKDILFNDLAYNPFTQKMFVKALHEPTDAVVNGEWDLNGVDTNRASYLHFKETYSGPATNTFTYPYGVENEVVWAVDILGDVSKHTLDINKQFTTTSDKTYLVFGKGIKAELCLMPVEAGMQWGSAQMAMKAVDQVQVRVYKSYSFRIKEINSAFSEERIVSKNGEDYTGTTIVALSRSADTEQVICLTNERPEPFVVTSISMRGMSNDG